MLTTLSSVAIQNTHGIRKGTHAIYLTPTHSEIREFLDWFKVSNGRGDRSLFPAMWIPDEFFRCVKENKPWKLINPHHHQDLQDLYDSEFSDDWIDTPDPIKHAFTYAYRQINDYEEVSALELYVLILKQILKDGVPYMLYKDAINRANNHNYLGTIRGSNLCAEIVQYKDINNIAVCNIASIILPENTTNGIIDEHKFAASMATIVGALNKVIDINLYPAEGTEFNNINERPMGIGMQGFAELVCMYGYAYDSKEAYELSEYVAELMYYHAIDASCELAKIYGTFKGFNQSYLGKGKFNWELYNDQTYKHKTSPRLDWESLRHKVLTHGTRNSMFIAYMPTGTTSGLTGYTPCFEPFNGMIYKRKSNVGEYMMINKMLVRELNARKLYYRDNIVNAILSSPDGGIGNVEGIPDDIKQKFKTAYEIDNDSIVQHAIYRTPYCDQSASMNLFLKKASTKELSQLLINGWKGGLKTGSYYTRVMTTVTSQKISNFGCETCTS